MIFKVGRGECHSRQIIFTKRLVCNKKIRRRVLKKIVEQKIESVSYEVRAAKEPHPYPHHYTAWWA